MFDRLERLRDCVILFDEIEEFCLDRTTPGLGMESRILATAMLAAAERPATGGALHFPSCDEPARGVR